MVLRAPALSWNTTFTFAFHQPKQVTWPSPLIVEQEVYYTHRQVMQVPRPWMGTHPYASIGRKVNEEEVHCSLLHALKLEFILSGEPWTEWWTSVTECNHTYILLMVISKGRYSPNNNFKNSEILRQFLILLTNENLC